MGYAFGLRGKLVSLSARAKHQKGNACSAAPVDRHGGRETRSSVRVRLASSLRSFLCAAERPAYSAGRSALQTDQLHGEAIPTHSHGRVSQPSSPPSERASANSMQDKLCGMVHTLTETSFPRRPKHIRPAKTCIRSVGWDGRQAIPSHLRMQSD